MVEREKERIEKGSRERIEKIAGRIEIERKEIELHASFS